MNHDFEDTALERFASDGPPALPPGGSWLHRDGVDLWYASFGHGPAVLLLHGGLGNASNFGHQVPALVAAGYRVVVLDSRGQGRSSWDGRPFSYAQLADDARALLDYLELPRAALVGWSDGACTSLALAKAVPARAAAVLFFACNVDPSGTRPFVMTDTIGNCLTRHRKDYAALSPHPGRFDQLSAALQTMQGSQPNYSAEDLGRISVPVTVVHAEHDEFILASHARYVASAIPGAKYVELPGVSHFAPVQRPALFNRVVRELLEAAPAERPP